MLGGSFLCADQVSLSEFGYLNTNENSLILLPKESQDMLNADISPGGKSIKKRQGYGLYKNVFSVSSGVHGGYHGFDSTGNDIQIWGSSVSVKGIVADGSPNTIVSSMTVNSTIDCADTQGSFYCVSSNHDFYVRTNGTTLTNWYTTPLGTMVESTPDRVVVSGVSASPNTLFVSQSNTFTNFTTGVNATDAFTEVIAAPGSRITHIRWGCQKLLWWKDQSFGYFDFDDQYSAQVRTVSDVIGTLDNTSAVDPGGNIWFRGQDGHTYKYDCSGLEKMTVDITPQIQQSGRRTTNSWTQTTQSDFQSGASVPTGRTSTTISAGDVVVSSYSVSEYTNTSQWISGSTSNLDVGTSSISLSLNSADLSNNSFESGQTTNWALVGTRFTNVASYAASCGTINPQDGTKFEKMLGISNIGVSVINANTSALISSHTLTFGTECSWVIQTIPLVYSNKGTLAKLVFNDLISSTLTSDSFVLNGNAVKYYANFGHTTGPSVNSILLDNVTNTPRSSITSGSFTSQIFDTTFTSAVVQAQSNWTVSTSTPAFGVITASNSTTGPWTQILSSTGTNANAFRYLKYVSTISIASTENALTYISSATLISGTTGSFYSTWKNAPNFTAWGTFNPTAQDNGGSHTYYVRASSSAQSVLNSTVTWIAQSANAQVATSTVGVYFQIRDDFLVTQATNTPTLNDFTVNWFEGAASDQAYMLYFDNAIWESVAYGTGISTNNYVFRYDLINEGWGPYYFGGGGMLVQNNHLFFGSVTTGDVFQFGSGASDNGTAVNAYWRSKSFTGSDPFLQNQLSNIDVFAKKDTGTTLTSTYTLDTSSVTAYSVVLSTSNAIVQSRKLLPSGKLGYTFDIKLGDSSTSSQWEVLGLRLGYIQQPYRPTP